MYITESLCCIPEMNKHCQSTVPPIEKKIKQHKNKMLMIFRQQFGFHLDSPWMRCPLFPMVRPLAAYLIITLLSVKRIPFGLSLGRHGLRERASVPSGWSMMESQPITVTSLSFNNDWFRMNMWLNSGPWDLTGTCGFWGEMIYPTTEGVLHTHSQ